MFPRDIRMLLFQVHRLDSMSNAFVLEKIKSKVAFLNHAFSFFWVFDKFCCTEMQDFNSTGKTVKIYKFNEMGIIEISKLVQNLFPVFIVCSLLT